LRRKSKREGNLQLRAVEKKFPAVTWTKGGSSLIDSTGVGSPLSTFWPCPRAPIALIKEIRFYTKNAAVHEKKSDIKGFLFVPPKPQVHTSPSSKYIINHEI